MLKPFYYWLQHVNRNLTFEDSTKVIEVITQIYILKSFFSFFPQSTAHHHPPLQTTQDDGLMALFYPLWVAVLSHSVTCLNALFHCHHYNTLVIVPGYYPVIVMANWSLGRSKRSSVLIWAIVCSGFRWKYFLHIITCLGPWHGILPSNNHFAL